MSKVEELIAESKLNELLKKKECEKSEKDSHLGIGDCRCCCSSGSDRICGILLLYTGLSGRFRRRF